VSDQLLTVVFLLSAGQGLFLGLALLFSKSGNCIANRYLGLFTLLIAITLVDFSFGDADAEPFAFLFRSVFWPRDFLFGPVLFFYVREMCVPGRYRLLPFQWMHFLPGAIHAAIYWLMPLFNGLLHQAILKAEFDGATAYGEDWLGVESIVAVLHFGLYLWLSIKILNLHDARIKASFSNIEKINLQWLRRLLWGVSAIFVFWVLEDLFSFPLNDMVYTLLGTSMVVLIFSMSYLGLRQPVIFIGNTASLNPPAKITDNKDTTKYQTSSLSPELSKGLLDELQDLMLKQRPYLDSQLSLPYLAQELKVSINYLSQVINEQLDQNFFDFVNGYRIEEAKKRLMNDERKENILTIATESGFNSKSSFYTAFKKHTSMTPGEFRKRKGA